MSVNKADGRRGVSRATGNKPCGCPGNLAPAVHLMDCRIRNWKPRKPYCTECDGTGFDHSTAPLTDCKRCNGTGCEPTPSIGTCPHCNSVLSAVTADCVHGIHCPGYRAPRITRTKRGFKITQTVDPLTGERR